MIRPALIWCDQRSQPQVDAINQKVGKDNVLAFTANPVLTGFTLPKLLWVRDNEPRSFERLQEGAAAEGLRPLLPDRRVLQRRLRRLRHGDVRRGDAAVVAQDDGAARPGRVDPARRGRVERGRPARSPPRRPRPPDSRPARRSWAARATRRPARWATASSSRASSPCTLGTSGVVFAHLERANYDPAGRVHTFCHAVTGKWHVMGVTQGAGTEPPVVPEPVAPGDRATTTSRPKRPPRRSARRASSGSPT